jgi:hypothetical protein
MADEPERRVVGAMVAELERQAHEAGPYSYYLDESVSPDGSISVSGRVDLYLLARAVITEIKENPL